MRPSGRDSRLEFTHERRVHPCADRAVRGAEPAPESGRGACRARLQACGRCVATLPAARHSDRGLRGRTRAGTRAASGRARRGAAGGVATRLRHRLARRPAWADAAAGHTQRGRRVVGQRRRRQVHRGRESCTRARGARRARRHVGRRHLWPESAHHARSAGRATDESRWQASGAFGGARRGRDVDRIFGRRRAADGVARTHGDLGAQPVALRGRATSS